MKVRYCHANNFKNPPCSVGWEIIGPGYSHSCTDDPKEVNCKYLVYDKPEIEFCPTCGTALGIKNDEPSK